MKNLINDLKKIQKELEAQENLSGNELMDCEYMDKQYESDMKILTAIIVLLLAFILFLIF